MTLVADLVAQLSLARDAYDSGHPFLSDTEYDLLEADLRSLDPENPYLTKVGSPKLSTKWAKVDLTKLPITMGSQNKSLSRVDLEAFWKKAEDKLYVASLKLDGMSILLEYIGGKFTRAITRGDGATGEDITSNVRKMQGVVAIIPSNSPTYIRGEVVLTKTAFNKAKADGVQANTPRNAGVGFAKDSTGVNAHRLKVYCYDLEGDDCHRTFEADKFELLETMGFTCAPWALVGGLWSADPIDANDYSNFWYKFADCDTERGKDLDLPADGVVIKCNSVVRQKEIGFSSNGLNPEFAIAHKFAPPVCVCEVLGITWEPGPSGVITPVLQVDAILDGTNLRNVSSHNLKRLLDLGVFIGCNVMVERAGMVIPYLVRVV